MNDNKPIDIDGPAKRVWHVYSTDGIFGPYTGREIRRFRAEGHISDDFFVYREGFNEWIRLGNVTELPPAPPPPTTQVPVADVPPPAIVDKQEGGLLDESVPQADAIAPVVAARRPYSKLVAGLAASLLIAAGFILRWSINPEIPDVIESVERGISADNPYYDGGSGAAGFSLPLSEIANRARQVKLPNGLNIIFRHVPEAESAALAVFYSVGGDHDPPGKSGLAHLLEHLYVVSPADRFAERSADEIFARYRSGWNAQTGDDFTVFSTVFSANDLEAELEEAAARMGTLEISESVLDREKSRVITELRAMYSGNPILAAMNNARESAAPAASGNRKGGTTNEVLEITADDLRNRWSTLYKPANATLVVAGAFEPQVIMDSIVRNFAALPSGTRVESAPTRQAPGIRGVRRVAVDPQLPGIRSHASLGYRAPDHQSELYPAYLVHVVRMWILSAKINFEPSQVPPPVYYAPLDDPAVFFVNSPISRSESRADAINRLDMFVKESTSASLEPGDISTAINFFGPFLGLTEIPEDMLPDNLYGLTFSLGRSHQIGIDPAELRRKIESVTNEDLKRVAREVFVPSNRAAVVAVVGGKSIFAD